jgi:hypothetical protein
MSRLLIVILIIAVIAILWYQWLERTRAEARKRADEDRLASGARAARQPLPPAASAAAPAAPVAASGAEPRAEPSRGGALEEAADVATGIGYEQATDQMEIATAELAEARQQAEEDAERLAAMADAALAEVRAAAETADAGDEIAGELDGQEVLVAERISLTADDFRDRADIVADAIAAANAGSVPPGAIRGDGGHDCPPAYPIKGNQSSMLYHLPGSPTYQSTIPEFCFSSIEAASAAGFSPTKR